MDKKKLPFELLNVNKSGNSEFQLRGERSVLNPYLKESLLQSESIKSTSIALTAFSTVSTLLLIYAITKDNNNKIKSGSSTGRSTPLPGFGTLGDNVNELIELFLDALAVYVHNDTKWECQRRMLCEANQRASDYGIFQGILMYFLSLGVSFVLQNQPVSQSLEAMKFGRRGNDCTQLYPKCPFSL